MTAAGEKRFSTKSHEVQKFEFTPLVPADYRFKIRGDKAEVKKSNSPDSSQLPYVNLALEALNTATKEGGKNRLVFHRFFLSLVPTEKGGYMFARADQIKGLSLALGETIDLPTREFHNNKTGEMEECIDPKALVQWLKDNDGRELSGHVKIEVAKAEDKAKGYGDKNVISYFIEADGEPAEDTTEAAATDDEEAEAEEETDEDEAPKKPAKKAPVKAPAKKGKK